jgi:predicted esterase
LIESAVMRACGPVILLLSLAFANLSSAAAKDSSLTNAPALATLDVAFSETAPYASAAELARRLGIKTVPAGYAIGDERFRIGLPPDYSSNSAWGLFVWVSPANQPRIPRAWEQELTKRRFLLVSAYRAGNERNAIERCRLALDATYNLCRQYRIDRNRIYIGGFSGGGRIASILGVSCADVFAGCLAVCGVDFHQQVPAGGGQFYPATYRPDSRLAARAREHGRFVLLTGEFDPNRENTKATAEHGFRANRFRHISYLEVKGMKHALPSAAVFGSALAYLDGTDVTKPGAGPAPSAAAQQRP